MSYSEIVKLTHIVACGMWSIKGVVCYVPCRSYFNSGTQIHSVESQLSLAKSQYADNVYQWLYPGTTPIAWIISSRLAISRMQNIRLYYFNFRWYSFCFYHVCNAISVIQFEFVNWRIWNLCIYILNGWDTIVGKSN